MCLRLSAGITQYRRADCFLLPLQGIIRRVQEDGPNRGNVDLDILPRSVRYRLKDVIDEARACHAGAQDLALVYLKVQALAQFAGLTLGRACKSHHVVSAGTYQ